MLKYPITVIIDTNIFDAAKYDFSENSPLSLLVSLSEKKNLFVVVRQKAGMTVSFLLFSFVLFFVYCPSNFDGDLIYKLQSNCKQIIQK